MFDLSNRDIWRYYISGVREKQVFRHPKARHAAITTIHGRVVL